MGVDDALGLILQSVARLVLKGAARLVTSKLVYSTGAGQRARSVLPPVHEVSNIDITVGVRVLASPVEEANSEAAFVCVCVCLGLQPRNQGLEPLKHLVPWRPYGDVSPFNPPPPCADRYAPRDKVATFASQTFSH